MKRKMLLEEFDGSQDDEDLRNELKGRTAGESGAHLSRDDAGGGDDKSLKADHHAAAGGDEKADNLGNIVIGLTFPSMAVAEESVRYHCLVRHNAILHTHSSLTMVSYAKDKKKKKQTYREKKQAETVLGLANVEEPDDDCTTVSAGSTGSSIKNDDAQPNDDYKFKLLVCMCFGKPPKSKGGGKRPKQSYQAKGCGFAVRIKRNTRTGKIEISRADLVHKNHEATPEEIMSHYKQRQLAEEDKKELERLVLEYGVKCGKIYMVFKEKYPSLIRKDVHNCIARLRRQEMGESVALPKARSSSTIL